MNDNGEHDMEQIKLGRPRKIKEGKVKGVYMSRADEVAVLDFGRVNECKSFSEAVRLVIWRFLRSRSD